MKNLFSVLLIAILLYLVTRKTVDIVTDKKLSENFNLKEFLKTNYVGIKNIPNEQQVSNLEFLVKEVLQPLRDYLGKPVEITSGFRSKELNFKVGGSATSQHSKGEAADIKVKGLRPDYLADVIMKLGLPYDQMIIEKVHYTNGAYAEWLHVSAKKEGNRKQLATITNTPNDLKKIFKHISYG